MMNLLEQNLFFLQRLLELRFGILAIGNIFFDREIMGDAAVCIANG